MANAFNTLPKIIQNALFSDEYGRFIASMATRFDFSEEQKDVFNQLISDLLYGQCAVDDIVKVVQERFGYTPEQSALVAREIVRNMVLPFASYFGDYSEYYRSLGGDPEEDVRQSPLTGAVLRQITEAVEGMVEDMGEVDWGKESVMMRELFARHLTELFYGPDGDHKVGLNDTILALLRMYDMYNEKLLGAMYENEQEIGAAPLTLPDGTAQRPTVANWIKDFLGFSGGTISSIALAKYVSQNKNVSSLQERDKDAVRRLLETFIVLKNFPDSLDSIPEDQWKIIPYYHTEETTKIPRKEKETSLDPGLRRDDKTAQTPTITVVPAPEQRTGSGTRLRQGFGAAVAKTEPDPMPDTISQTKLSQTPTTIDFSPLTDAVIGKTGAILPDTARERVKKILETRVRNVRNDIDTKGRLMAPFAEGGAGLGEEEASKMLAETKNAQKAIAEGKADEYAPKKAEEKEGDDVSLDSRRSLSRVSPRDQDDRGDGNDKEGGNAAMPKMVIKEVDGVPTLVEKPEKKGNGKKEEKGGDNVSLDAQALGRDDKEAPHEMVPTPVLPAPIVPPVKVPPHLEDAQVIPVVVKTSGAGLDPDRSLSRVSPRDRDDKGGKLSRTTAPAIGAEKKPIPDVKALPRLVTFVDELRALSMKDIRRISQDSKAACQKIADKINALAKESLSKRADAINAWKESPAYALYLEIGQLNISQDMAKLAEERKAAGKEYLTAEEFDALLDLNEKLRF